MLIDICLIAVCSFTYLYVLFYFIYYLDLKAFLSKVADQK